MGNVRNENFEKWRVWEMRNLIDNKKWETYANVRNEKSENSVLEIGKRKKNVGNGKCVTSKMWEMRNMINDKKWVVWEMDKLRNENVINGKRSKWEK